jgi:hypothetical protein
MFANEWPGKYMKNQQAGIDLDTLRLPPLEHRYHTALIFIRSAELHLVGKVDIGSLIQAVQHALPVVSTAGCLQASVQVHRVPI